MVFGQLLLCPPKPSGAENEMENTTHVLMCPDGRALEQWNKSLEKLAIWMEQTKVPASIHEATIEGLKRYATTMEEWLVMIQDPLNDLQRW